MTLDDLIEQLQRVRAERPHGFVNVTVRIPIQTPGNAFDFTADTLAVDVRDNGDRIVIEASCAYLER